MELYITNYRHSNLKMIIYITNHHRSFTNPRKTERESWWNIYKYLTRTPATSKGTNMGPECNPNPNIYSG